MQLCTWEDCDRPTVARGFCGLHYNRMRRHHGMDALPKVDAFTRLMDSVSKDEDGCWRASLGVYEGLGYSYVSDQGKVRPGHRVSYERLVGAIPEGLTIDHLCRVRNCVNPEHLEPVTSKENILRGESMSAKHSRKTHCPKGHPYDMVRSDTGGRACHECLRERAKATRLRKLATAPPCTIEGCDKPQIVRTWCQAHYARFSRYGSPTFKL